MTWFYVGLPGSRSMIAIVDLAVLGDVGAARGGAGGASAVVDVAEVEGRSRWGREAGEDGVLRRPGASGSTTMTWLDRKQTT